MGVRIACDGCPATSARARARRREPRPRRCRAGHRHRRSRHPAAGRPGTHTGHRRVPPGPTPPGSQVPAPSSIERTVTPTAIESRAVDRAGRRPCPRRRATARPPRRRPSRRPRPTPDPATQAPTASWPVAFHPKPVDRSGSSTPPVTPPPPTARATAHRHATARTVVTPTEPDEPPTCDAKRRDKGHGSDRPGVPARTSPEGRPRRRTSRRRPRSHPSITSHRNRRRPTTTSRTTTTPHARQDRTTATQAPRRATVATRRDRVPRSHDRLRAGLAAR